MCLILCQDHAVLITVVLQYSLKPGRMIPPTLFFWGRVKIALAIRGFYGSIINCGLMVLVL